MNLTNKIKFILKAPVSYFLSKKYSKPNVMNDYKTLDYVIENNCSLCRYGDGEFNLMHGVGIKFQDKNAGIALRLNEISEIKSKDNILICIPNIFGSLSIFTQESRRWWGRYLYCTRGYWYRAFRGKIYGDTNVSRFYVENVNKNRDDYVLKLQTIWQDKRILIVEGKKSRLGMGNDLFAGASTIKRLLCPSKNAFDYYDEILSAVNNEIDSGKYDMVICALGPTATVLCYDLSDKIQALDLGHIDVEYEWYLSKAQHKQAIKNKSVTEVTDNCDDFVDSDYESQIIGEIS